MRRTTSSAVNIATIGRHLDTQLRLVEPSGDLGMPLAETAWRNSNPDANREVPFGQGDHLSWVAGHYISLLFETRITLTFRCVQPLGAALLRACRRAADGRGARAAMLRIPARQYSYYWGVPRAV